MADFAHPVRGRVITRRTFLVGLAGVAAGFVIRPLVAAAPGLASELTPSLLSAPLDLGGVWKSSPADAVLRVLSRVRAVSLEGLRLLSDRQPDRLHVDNHPSGWPAVWLHNDHTNTAWIIVDIGPADWCKLSYQFGHELGHVLCNSWNAQSKPRVPCQWLEESMVEAFSIRGLGRLAASWESNPPFAGDAAFGAAIREYRENLIKNYREPENIGTSTGSTEVPADPSSEAPADPSATKSTDERFLELAPFLGSGSVLTDPLPATGRSPSCRWRRAVDVEEVGNQVKRLAPKSLAATLRKQGYANVRWRGTHMYYPHQARRLFRWFDQSA